ncbi:hypothetical protein J6590_021068 [Homalodisca vitripennis]|nr:hypothetical protein J6590_021068 [Homalodisca vitripennis]
MSITSSLPVAVFRNLASGEYRCCMCRHINYKMAAAGLTSAVLMTLTPNRAAPCNEVTQTLVESSRIIAQRRSAMENPMTPMAASSVDDP